MLQSQSSASTSTLSGEEAGAFIPDWAREMDCAITVCDANANIIYMNDASRRINSPEADIIGHNLRQYHPPRAIEIIDRLLREGGYNAYTISKRGQRKMIYQAAWRQGGQIAGLVEISMVIPEELPHYVRS